MIAVLNLFLLTSPDRYTENFKRSTNWLRADISQIIRSPKEFIRILEADKILRNLKEKICMGGIY